MYAKLEQWITSAAEQVDNHGQVQRGCKERIKLDEQIDKKLCPYVQERKKGVTIVKNHGTLGRMIKKTTHDHGEPKSTNCQGKGNGRSQKKLQEDNTRVGTDAFHPRVLLHLSDETCQLVADFLLVQVIGKKPATASCIMFFFLSKTDDKDKPIAPLATQIWWWEWVG